MFKITQFYYYLFACLVLSVSSCISIEGVTDDYKTLTEEERRKVIMLSGNIDELQINDSIYLVNHVQIQEWLNTKDNAIVYGYTPYCTSENCIAPSLLYECCVENDFDLLVISDTFNGISKTPNGKTNIFMIDSDYYQTKNRRKYTRLFFDNLTETSEKERQATLFYLFKRGRYCGVSNNVDDLFDK